MPLTFDLDPTVSALSGQCQVCGCTDEEACPGGCIWANAGATLCSRCAQEVCAICAVRLEPLRVGDWCSNCGRRGPPPRAYAVDDEPESLDWRPR